MDTREQTGVDAAVFDRVLRQLEMIAKRQAPRIAFKANGRILFLNLAEIVAVQAEGNYVCLQLRPGPYLLRESLPMKWRYMTGAADPSDHVPTETTNTSIGSVPLN